MAAGQSSLRGMHEVFGACPLDCPDGCSWVVTVDDEGRAVNLQGQPRAPVHGGRAVREGQRLPRAHARARTASCTRSSASAPRARAGSSGSAGTRRSRRSRTRLHAVSDEYGGEAIWPFQGTGTLGLRPGPRGPRRPAAVERARRVAARHDRLQRRGPPGRDLRHRDRGRDGPGDVPALEADPAVGHEHAHERPPPVEVHPQGAQAGRAHRRDRPAQDAHRGAGGRAHRAAARHRRRARARAAERDRRAAAREDREYLREHTVGWPEFKAADPRVPARRRPPRSPASTRPRSSRSASGSRPPARPASAARWACSATPAAATRCGCCTRSPA